MLALIAPFQLIVERRPGKAALWRTHSSKLVDKKWIIEALVVGSSFVSPQKRTENAVRTTQSFWLSSLECGGQGRS